MSMPPQHNTQRGSTADVMTRHSTDAAHLQRLHLQQQEWLYNEQLHNNQKLNKYLKLEKVGEGTYGIVYKAKNTVTGQMVALKKIRFENVEEGRTAAGNQW